MVRLSHLPKPAIFILGVFLAASLFLPLPYVILTPGQGQDVLHSMIKISGQKTYPSSGKLLLTTVYVTSPDSKLFGFEVIPAWLSSNSIVYPRSALYPDNMSSKEIDATNVAEMVGSQQSAAAAALTYLNFPVKQWSVSNSAGVKTMKYLLPFPVSFALKDTGGPSGGLVFALAIVTKLTPQDFLKGRVVAGTGTIDMQGQIGAIGGIDDKLVAAKRAGATVFLAPVANCNDVTHVPAGITVYSVNTLKEAISVLKDSKSAIPHCTWQRNR